jgi:hypothetical protein
MTTITTWTVLGPAHWACYFINGDATGFDTDDEQRWADAWYAHHVPDGASIVDCSDTPEFSRAREAWLTTPFEAGDVIEYTILQH